MSVPEPWEAALLALAAWRTFQLIALDEILETPRDWLLQRLSEKWELFIACPYCAGFWIALAWWGAWQWQEHWALVVATPWALSAGVIAASKVLSSE